MNKSEQQIDCKTHILIGVRASAVIADWPYVPPQADVQKQMDCARDPDGQMRDQHGLDVERIGGTQEGEAIEPQTIILQPELIIRDSSIKKK